MLEERLDITSQSTCKGEFLADIAGVVHSALRQDPYKPLLEDCKVSPNTFLLTESVKRIIEHKTPAPQIADENDEGYIDKDKEAARKLKLEADKLQDEKNLRREKWAPIAEMESEWIRQLREVLELSQETLDDIKSRVDLTAEELDEIDVAFANGMNRIAGPN